jgi:glutathione S-transferase
MLKLWELSPSPNNTKVRMALRFKGIDFEAIPVNPKDRRGVIESSGQELTPVIEDRGIVLNESEAILAYLDANYRETPRLNASDRAGRKRADDWKIKLDRSVGAYWLPIFLFGIGRCDSFEPSTRRGFEDFLKGLEDELDDTTGFCGAELPICDLRVAQWATYALPGAGLVERVPLFGKFRELFGVERGSLPALERFLGPGNDRLA